MASTPRVAFEPQPETEPLLEVHLLELPLDLHAAAQEHGDELMREFQLIVEGAQDPEHGESHVPHRLLTLAQAMSHRYSELTAEQEAEVSRAITNGQSTLADLVFRVPRHAGDAARTLAALLDEVDAYCREGRQLLTLETPAQVLRYRRWYLGQFVDQLNGAPAVPWPRYGS